MSNRRFTPSVRLAAVLCLLTLGWTLCGRAHDYFAALTRINVNERAQTVEVIHRLTLHDVDVAVSVMANEKISFLNDGEFDQAEAALESYLADHFTISTQARALDLTYLGAEVRGGTLYAYAEAPFRTAPRDFTVRNSILFDLFDQQRNTVVITQGDRRGSSVFKPGESEKRITPARD